MGRCLAAVVVALCGLALPGCGSGGSKTTLAATAAQQALAAWRSYPVGISPRAIVLDAELGGRVERPRPKRLTRQQRIDTGRYQLPAGLSSNGGLRGGYHVISPRAAARRLPIATPATPVRTPRLRVIGVTPGAGHFPTDRPGVMYPDWLFHLAGFHRPTRVLAARVWAAPIEHELQLPGDVVINQVGESATISNGGHSLRVAFVGAPAGTDPCDASYTARVYTSRTAVAPVIWGHSPAPPHGHGVWCAVAGAYRHVTVRLPQPLGARVVVNVANRQAIPVTGPIG